MTKVTCLMVTRDRVEMAKRAIDCYTRQDYPDRDLVIISESRPSEHARLRAYLESLERNDIRLVGVPAGLHALGALRNRSIAEADGEFVCQWDDDDLYHPQRLSVQMEAIRRWKSEACFLGDQLQFVETTRSLYWCDWQRARRSSFLRCTPNTMVCSRRKAPAYPEAGEAARRGEDTLFLKSLCLTAKVSVLRGCGAIYVYVTHGGNTWDSQHHLGIVRTTGLEAEELQGRRSHILSALRMYPLLLPLTVRGYDGRAAFCVGRDGVGTVDAPPEC